MIECPICDEINEINYYWFSGLIICDNCMTVLEVEAIDFYITYDGDEGPIYEAKPICLSLLKSFCFAGLSHSK